jgi:general secretion pathway protein I
MVALAIVAIALVALMGLGNRSIAVNAHLQKITQATLLAQQRMTEVEIEAAGGALLVLNEEGVFDEPFDEFRWRLSYEDTPLPNLQIVTVTVAWGDEARNELVDLNSFIFR